MRERKDTTEFSLPIGRNTTSLDKISLFKIRSEWAELYKYPRQSFYRLSHSGLSSLLNEAEDLLRKGEYMQASEKYYKFMEESVKVLAERYAPEMCEKASRYGGWGFWKQEGRHGKHGLSMAYHAVRNALEEQEGENLSETFALAWKSAQELHGEAFHEFALPEETILEDAKNIKKFWERFKDKLEETERLVIYRGSENEEIIYG